MNINIEKRVKAYQKIKDIETKRKELFVARQNDIKNSSNNDRDAVEVKYADDIYNLEMELNKYDNMLWERSRKLSKFSTFPRKDIMEVLKYVLGEVYNEPFVYEYGTVYCVDDNDNMIFDNMGILTTKKNYDDFIISFNKFGANQRFGYRNNQSDDIVFFDFDANPHLTKDSISFYDLDGNKVIDSKNDVIYSFIDQLIDYKWIYKKDNLSRYDFFNQANKFLENYSKEDMPKKKVKK